MQAFSHGVGPFFHQMTDPDFLNAVSHPAIGLLNPIGAAFTNRTE